MTRCATQAPVGFPESSNASPSSVLAALDLSPVSDRVVGRVARLPLADRARVTLLHVLPPGLRPGERRIAERDARAVLSAEARHLAERLPRSVAVDTLVRIGSPDEEIVTEAQARSVELIVMGRGGARSIRDAFLGSSAERVIRTGGFPVLAVRLAPRSDYRRPTLAADLDGPLASVVGWLLRLLPPPRPTIHAIHAFEPPFGGLSYPSLSGVEMAERRGQARRAASARLARSLEDALGSMGIPAHAARWRYHVVGGAPRVVVAKAVERIDTDLLALGTQGRSGLPRVFLGSVAGELLRHVASDVMVVPPHPGSRETNR